MSSAMDGEWYWLGVDAGGTGTRAALVAGDGRVVGRGEAGPGNPRAAGEGPAEAAWLAAARGALDGRAGAVVRGAVFGVAGVREADEAADAARRLAALGLAGGLRVTGDLETAHAAALGGGPGVVVIAGTGSAAWAKSADGRAARAGGWGWLADDAGGGYWLARRALVAACEGEDRRGPATTLAMRAAAFYGAADLRGALTALQGPGHDRARVAAFAREVFAAAEAGDAVAASCCAAAAVELVRLAEAARSGLIAAGCRSVAEPALPLALAGGLPLGAAVAERATAAGFAPRVPWGPPVLGAVALAAEDAGAGLDAAAKARLLATWTTPA